MMKILVAMVAALVAWICHALRMTEFATEIALISFAIFFVYWALHNKGQVVKYLPLIVMSILWLAGVWVCECSDIDLWEIGDVAGPVGAFPLATLHVIIVLLVISSADRFFRPVALMPAEKASVGVVVLGWLALGCSIIMFAYVFKRPSFLLGLDRFAYNATLPLVIVRGRNVLQCVLPVVVVMVLLSNWTRVRKFIFAGAILSPFVLFNVWTGYKFDIFFFLLVNVGCPIILLKFSQNGEFKVSCCKLIPSLCVAAGLLALILVIQFKSYESEDVGVKFTQRVSQQGQLWWKVFYLFDGVPHVNEVDREWHALFSRIGQKAQDVEFEPYGIYKLMELTTPVKVYENKLDSGSRYTSRGLELPYYYFGVAGILAFAVLSAIGYVFLMNAYLFSLANRRIVEAILFLKLLTTFDRASSMGEWNLLLAKDVCLYLMIIAFACFLRALDLNRKIKE